MSDLELKPCPFCGHKLDDNDAYKGYFGASVRCPHCGATGPNMVPRKEWWDKRAGDGDA